ncbi:hypothetical protein DEI97_003655 [Curtobacterium sp. MCLR17_032]|uniref:hypothetical protein n=1 Tax=Curtobacterium sp. MCLR17_032 TaxID=2175650 RepID=UPI0011B81BCE|nr:hypothetical protein [Curtobacterium sp. MCLR17_032]WIE62252.1 hypothetical protein DEI97_003655 [Curtobacterium sp. MCLR17_032]
MGTVPRRNPLAHRPHPTRHLGGPQLLMPGLEWVNAAYSGRPQLTLPYGLGDTTDLTNTLTVLKLAGLRAVVESHDTIRLADGRRARLPTLTQRPRNDDPNDAELLLLAPRTVTATQIALAEQTASVVLVDVDRRRVWIDGKQILGTKERWKDAAPIYVTFAVARMLAVNGSTFDGLVWAGLTAGQVDDALARLGNRVHRTRIGWESRQVGGLVDFAIACYPGPGGVRTRWTSDLPLIKQSERLIEAGCRISGRGISERPGYPAISKRAMPYRLVAFTEQELDMPALGFEPDTVGYSGTELIRPADPTIFLTAAAAGYADRTDDIITANTLLRADLRNDEDAASLEEVRNRLQFLADTGYDLRHNLPN